MLGFKQMLITFDFPTKNIYIALNPKAMKIITLLNITLIILTAVVVADVTLTIYSPVKTDSAHLIAPITILLSVFLIRTIHAARQKTLDQLTSVKLNK